jgi:hypothetical protein
MGLYHRRYVTAPRHPHRSNVVCHHHTLTSTQIDELLTACGWYSEATSSAGLSAGLIGRLHCYQSVPRLGEDSQRPVERVGAK